MRRMTTSNSQKDWGVGGITHEAHQIQAVVSRPLGKACVLDVVRLSAIFPHPLHITLVEKLVMGE